MSSGNLISSGVVVLTVIGIAYGGTFLLRVTTGGVPANDLQRTFYRAGHAHAGVLVILGLVVRLLLDVPSVPAWSLALSDLVLYAAVLVPAGFFLSATGRDPVAPNRWRALIWVGTASLTVGLAATGVGLISAGIGAASSSQARHERGLDVPALSSFWPITRTGPRSHTGQAAAGSPW